MQQILSGQKECLLTSQVNHITVPYFPELSIDALISKANDDPRIKKHLPDPIEKKKPNKEFVWHVINYFQPDFIKQAISDATKARLQRRMAQDRPRPLLIVKPEMLQRLQDMNLIRCKLRIFSLNFMLMQRPRCKCGTHFVLTGPS